MANLKTYNREILFTVLAFIWLWFVLTNANVALGQVYLWASGISLFLLFIDIMVPDRNPVVTFQKEKGKWFKAIMAGAVGWVIILLTSFVLLKIAQVKASFTSIMGSLNAANPAFSNSVVVNWVTASFAIGYAETQLFARLFKFFADRFNIQINKQNKLRFALIILIIFLGALFAIYHSTAKGVENIDSLVVVGAMMVISLYMIVYFDGETRQAVFAHMIANGVAGYLIIKSGSMLFSSLSILPLIGG